MSVPRRIPCLGLVVIAASAVLLSSCLASARGAHRPTAAKTKSCAKAARAKKHKKHKTHCHGTHSKSSTPQATATAPQACGQFADDNAAASKCLLAQPLADIDRLFGTLNAGPMPGYNKPAHGTFRCVWLDACGSETSVALLNTVVPLVWGGKTFFTDENGGWLWNRAAPLENPPISEILNGNTGVLIGNVQYAPSYLDGKRAVTITYEGIPDAPITIGNTRVVSGAPDDCRTFQPKLWLCNAWYDFRPAAAPERWAVFTLDFTDQGA
ncbi:MAG TPA: hypothetical protein VHU24_03010 [Solirubrobacterales bacterium]|jgi:hypothetical protein|nr:hypothetical protein [Solirubrobacterales bacterium]